MNFKYKYLKYKYKYLSNKIDGGASFIENYSFTPISTQIYHLSINDIFEKPSVNIDKLDNNISYFRYNFNLEEVENMVRNINNTINTIYTEFSTIKNKNYLIVIDSIIQDDTATYGKLIYNYINLININFIHLLYGTEEIFFNVTIYNFTNNTNYSIFNYKNKNNNLCFRKIINIYTILDISIDNKNSKIPIYNAHIKLPLDYSCQSKVKEFKIKSNNYIDIFYPIQSIESITSESSFIPYPLNEDPQNDLNIYTVNWKFYEGEYYNITRIHDTIWFMDYMAVPLGGSSRLCQYEGTCWCNTILNTLILTPDIRNKIITFLTENHSNLSSDIHGHSYNNIAINELYSLEDKILRIFYKLLIANSKPIPNEDFLDNLCKHIKDTVTSLYLIDIKDIKDEDLQIEDNCNRVANLRLQSVYELNTIMQYLINKDNYIIFHMDPTYVLHILYSKACNIKHIFDNININSITDPNVTLEYNNFVQYWENLISVYKDYLKIIIKYPKRLSSIYRGEDITDNFSLTYTNFIKGNLEVEINDIFRIEDLFIALYNYNYDNSNSSIYQITSERIDDIYDLYKNHLNNNYITKLIQIPEPYQNPDILIISGIFTSLSPTLTIDNTTYLLASARFNFYWSEKEPGHSILCVKWENKWYIYDSNNYLLETKTNLWYTGVMDEYKQFLEDMNASYTHDSTMSWWFPYGIYIKRS